MSNDVTTPVSTRISRLCAPAGAAQAMQHTSQTINGLRGPLNIRKINAEQDNQVRQAHHSAMNGLIQSEQVGIRVTSLLALSLIRVVSKMNTKIGYQ